jgi:1-deoxy-D-xylulose-5-phosphate reductoisomerase
LKRLAIIGSTGSIGRQTLEVVEQNFSSYKIVALTADRSDDLLAQQAVRFGVKNLCMYSREGASRLSAKLRDANITSGDEGLKEIASMDVDLLVVAGNGSACIEPTFEALRNGTDVALATKEVIVCAGHLIERNVYDKQIIPIDSEPSAIFQSLAGEDRFRLKEVLLTASGGPFFSKGLTWGDLKLVKPEEALDHPRWKMGRKITIDSSTLANKALEMIEISYMFGIQPEQVRIMLHRESEIHSGVTFIDGSTKLQASPPDMRIPISYALNCPARNFSTFQGLRFPVKWVLEDLPESMSRCIELGKRAWSMGAKGLIMYAASDELAVELFLAKKLPFHLIPEVIARTLAHPIDFPTSTPSQVVQGFKNSKQTAMEIGKRLCLSY